MMKFINKASLDCDPKIFRENTPFSHLVIDNFFHEEVAKKLSKGFPAYNSEKWHVYKNAIEDKKTLNSWNEFDTLQYRVFSELNSLEFLKFLEELVDGELSIDHGLHGGGLHIHADGGNLNPHLDYSIHPKIKLQRKINLIVYLEEDFQEDFGGHFGLWAHGDRPNRPGELVKEVVPLFNRGVILDTTQNSWHGLSRKLTLPLGKYRKSFASYYLQFPEKNVEQRSRALFAPREEQLDNAEVLKLIKMRADEGTHSQAYISSMGAKENMDEENIK